MVWEGSWCLGIYLVLVSNDTILQDEKGVTYFERGREASREPSSYMRIIDAKGK